MRAMKHHETVGAHVVASALHARPGERAAAVLARLAAEKPATLELVLGVDAHGHLLGAASLSRVVALQPDEPIDKALERDFPRVRPDTDQERAASLALHHGVDALPVVDEDGRALGVMPAQALMQVLRREHVEDLHVLAGIQRESSQARHAIEDPPMRRVRHRLPWLLAGELRTGMAIGAALGLLLPWWLARLGRDPALGSGPIATVIQDILSLLVYFAVVRAFGV
jgi:magnesium transporter